MTIKQYYTAVSEVANYTDREAYVSAMARSTIWGAAGDADIPAARLADLQQIWDACHRTYKEIAAMAGLSQRKLAERFGIPYRTMEAWSSGQNVFPVYTKRMMQECLGLLTVKVE